MKGLYDIFKCVFLRCLREFEKWSLIEKMRKNEEKMRKKLAPESPIIHYSLARIVLEICSGQNSSMKNDKGQ